MKITSPNSHDVMRYSSNALRVTTSGAAFVVLILVSSLASGQIPPAGTYKYQVAFAEWGGKSLSNTVTVVIYGDSVKVINDGTLKGTKGEIIERGRIVKHKATGQWIVASKPEDEFAEEVGGCSEGPRVIDFKNKKWWTC